MLNGRAKCRDSLNLLKYQRNEELPNSSSQKEGGCVHCVATTTSKDEADAIDAASQRPKEE